FQCGPTGPYREYRVQEGVLYPGRGTDRTTGTEPRGDRCTGDQGTGGHGGPARAQNRPGDPYPGPGGSGGGRTSPGQGREGRIDSHHPIPKEFQCVLRGSGTRV